MNAIDHLMLPIASLSLGDKYVWVQLNCEFEVVPTNTSHLLDLRCEHGQVHHVKPTEFSSGFVKILDTNRFQARYRPIKAQRVMSRSLLVLDDGALLPADAGDAVLCDCAGYYSVVAAARYQTCYEVVGYPGTPFPLRPFAAQVIVQGKCGSH